MNATSKAEKILREFKFDFSTFTMDGFLRYIGDLKGRELVAIPWEMPSTLFGAWISDGEEAREYIFYRNNISKIHQVHVQLHELAHFLCGHTTLRITQRMIADAAAGIAPLPFTELAQLRSPNLTEWETEAESLASLIQEQAIRNSKMDQLIHNTSEEKSADFMKRLGAV